MSRHYVKPKGMDARKIKAEAEKWNFGDKIINQKKYTHLLLLFKN